MTTIAEPAARPRSVFANAHFRNLWIGGGISGLGDQFYLIALPWLVLQLTGSNLAVGTVLMCAAIPRAVLMLGGGAVSDRIAPRRIMLTTASTRTIFVGAVGVLVWLHVVHLWHLYLLAFAFGVADAFGLPAMQALLPQLVEREQLAAANASFQAVYQTATILGPAPAGIVIKALGTAPAFIIDAISFLFVLVPIYGLPRTKPEPKPRAEGKHFGHDILEGLHYVWRDRAMRALTILMAGVNLCITGPIIVGLAALAKFKFGSPTAFGVLIAAWSGGALLGSITAGTRKQKSYRGWTMIVAFAVVSLGIAALGVLSTELSMGVVLAVTGILGGYNNIVLVSWFQSRVEHEFMGRVMSVLMFAWVGLMPVSYPIAGALAQSSVSGMFLIAGLTAAAITLLCAFSKSLRAVQ
ncbi:MAG TPA: MFS transporter [Thermoanaerobaculia bacterium]|jgi:MFS family permease|nr:MFS transporter [Thermoanaerobaculia bacterium]